MFGPDVRRPKDESKETVVILDVPVTLVCKRVLAETQNAHHLIVKVFRTIEVGNRDVDMINANHLDAHGGSVTGRIACCLSADEPKNSDGGSFREKSNLALNVEGFKLFA